MKNHPMIGRVFLSHIAPMIGAEPGYIRRVIIDAPYDDLVTIYVELLGDTRLFSISAEMMADMRIVRTDEMPNAITKAGNDA